MKRFIYISAMVAFLSAGCVTKTEIRPQHQEPNLVLIITNQSFDNPMIDITVTINGEQIVSQEFAVGDQHNFKVLRLRLPEGKNSIVASSTKGQASITESFDLPSKRWALLWYDYNQKLIDQGVRNAGRAFGFLLYDEPIGIE